MRFFSTMSIVLIMIFSFTVTVYAEFSYVGVKRCRICHRKKEDGEQYKIWQQGKHAKAFKSLGTDHAKQLAAKVGVNSDPQSAKECLICHASPLYDESGNKRDESMFGRRFEIEDGVQCEVCHGPGEEYRKKKTMETITEQGGAAKSPLAGKTGLLVPDKQLCLECHVEKRTVGGVEYVNPTYKSFNYEERIKEIAHPRP